MQINKKKLKKVIYTNILLFLLLVLYYFLNRNFGFKIICIFHELTGLLCPGCGITRCFFSILSLDFKKAFYYNQFVFILLPFFIGFYFYTIYNYIFDGKRKRIPNYIIIPVFIGMIIFTIIRNII